ncbi:hypothetical protein V7S43_018598 [Phytophthora oleae]|uniref:RNA cytosine-C(5)-methyltransferase NSUN2-like pre-PUA domain-containing protein n=1 Tax=Phytophthora oleae TaxID=2107226 RepID=A0ABD3EQ16_9STRA
MALLEEMRRKKRKIVYAGLKMFERNETTECGKMYRVCQAGLTHILPFMYKLVEANLNHTPVISLGGFAPTELFTGLPCPPPLDTLLLPGADQPLQRIDLATVDDEMVKLRASLAEMHAEVTDKKERRRFYQQSEKKGVLCNFLSETTSYGRVWTRA